MSADKIEHEIPEDLQEEYENACIGSVNYGESVSGAEYRMRMRHIERIAQLTADLAECKRDFFEADSLRAKLTDDVERLTAELEIAKQDRNMYDSAHKREAVASLRLAAELVDVKAERDELKKARDLFARGLEAEEKDCEELHDQVEKLTAERDAALRECEHVIEERRLTLNKFAALEAELSRLKVPVSAEVKDYLDLAISSLCGDRIHFCTSNAQEKQHRRDAKNAQELVDFIANRSKPPEVTK
jgi:chromosome segregation ATPase